MSKLLKRIANWWHNLGAIEAPRCLNCNSLLTDLSKRGYSTNADTPTHHCPVCGLYQYMRHGRMFGLPK